MKHHRFAEIWPLITGSDFDELKANIAAHGQRLPIVTYKGEVLDGRNRERACEELGIAPRYEEAQVASDDAALALVVSLNDHRRHLSRDERAFAAARLANIVNGSNRFAKKIVGVSKEIPTPTEMVMSKAADAMNVSLMTAKRAKAILTDSGEEGAKEVTSGKISLSAKATRIWAKRAAKGKVDKPRAPRGEGPRLVIANHGPVRHLTRKEVDPEFTGSPGEWIDKYGHVQILTAAGYATTRFSDWAANMKSLARAARDLPDWPTVDHNWLRQPAPSDTNKLADALAVLRPKIAEAEKLLERAQAATPQAKAAHGSRSSD